MSILLAGILMLVLDQFSKVWIRTRRARSSSRSFIARIRMVETVRSTFRDRRGRVSLAVGWMTALVCVWVLSESGAGLQTDLARLGAGAALGGAAGNLLDVFRLRAVTDFIDLGWWPVFNLADVGIVAGLALAFLPLT